MEAEVTEMLGAGMPPYGTMTTGEAGDAGTIAAIIVIAAFVIGMVVWVRSLIGAGRVDHPTGVTRLRAATVH